MIHKIERLTSIGKFRSHTASGNISFRKLTVIYAENGSGKTTLASVLKSLATNDPAIIQKRVSTTTPQFAQILKRSNLSDLATQTTHTFSRGAWSRTMNDVEIFDINFVNDNIYSGFDFTNDHKKQLHQFIVGAQGINIKNQIEQNKEDRKQLNQKISNEESQILTTVGNGLTLNELRTFYTLKVEQADKIDERIGIAEKNLQNARANTQIQAIPALQPLDKIIPSYELTQVISDLALTVAEVQNNTLADYLKDHCNDLRENGFTRPEAWLKIGYDYFTKKSTAQESVNCPFCLQEINKENDIIKACSEKFNEEFNDYLNRLNTHLSELQKLNFANQIQVHLGKLETNRERAGMWQPMLGNSIAAKLNIQQPDYAQLNPLTEAAIALVKEKQVKINTSIDSKSIESLVKLLLDINQFVDNYNKIVQQNNQTIQEFRSNLSSEAAASIELRKLNILKSRFTPLIEGLISSVTTSKQQITNLERAYTTLVEQEEVDATAFLSSYSARINHYLNVVFHTPFAIQSLSHVRPIGRSVESRVAYELTIHGQAIQFDTSQPNSVKECFSEGDKNTIALAFFLAKLDIDTTKQNKIVVIDDPLSSFDSHRRGYTVRIIKSLLSTVKQVVVLSHNEFFLHDIYSDVPAADKVALALQVNQVTHSTTIVPLNLEDIVDTSYFRHLKLLNNFLIRPDIAQRDYIRGLIRNTVEANLKFKFWAEINSIPENQRTFGRVITELENLGVTFRDSINTTSIFVKLKDLNGMSWQPHHGDPMPDMVSAGFNSNHMTIGELCNYVTDTLNVVNQI